jgi:hypothetical protein
MTSTSEITLSYIHLPSEAAPSLLNPSIIHEMKWGEDESNWDHNHWRLGYRIDEKRGLGAGVQKRPLKERYFFDSNIAGEHQVGVDYERKDGKRFSDVRR